MKKLNIQKVLKGKKMSNILIIEAKRGKRGIIRLVRL